jgi:hypothetical protein
MSKANISTTLIRSRRAVLAGIASATAVTAAGARPTDAAPAIDPIFAAIETHRKAAAIEQAAWDEVNRRHELGKKFSPSEEDALTDGPNIAASYALDEFAETVPTTLPGLRAMILYADKLEGEHTDPFSDCDLLATLATAVKALIGEGVQS